MFPGLSYRETMSGNYWRLDAPTDERAIAFTVEMYSRNLVEFARNKTLRVTGTIDAERLASGRELEGTVSFKCLSERRMPYRLSFVGDDGQPYELTGQREWSALAPIDSMTILPASVFDGRGDEVARATLRFDVRADWVAVMRSFRVRLRGS